MVVLEKYLLHIKIRLKKSESNLIFKIFFWSNLPSLDPLFYKWGSESYLLHSEGVNLIYYKKEWKYGLGVGHFERVEETDTFLWLISSRLSSLYFFLLLRLCQMFKNKFIIFFLLHTSSPSFLLGIKRFKKKHCLRRWVISFCLGVDNKNLE